MIEIDGSQGEGGGQVLRTSLALSILTRTPFRIANVRAGRARPGLLRQHLTAVEAAAEVGGATVSGAALGSRAVELSPAGPREGDYRFCVGTAGSTTLVLQTVLLPLLAAPGPSSIVLEGGTHNPAAPPFDFLERTFLPLLERMGARIRARLDRRGFYPAGGGKIRVGVDPAPRLGRIDLMERGGVRRIRARAFVSRLPLHIAERELGVARRELELRRDDLSVVEVVDGPGPGNVLHIEVETEALTEVFTGFGEKGTRAETVAESVVASVRRYLAAGVPVGEHLADQLLLPMALAGGGSFLTLEPSLHSRTNAEVIRRFLPVEVQTTRVGDDAWRVEVVRGESTSSRGSS